MNHQQLQMKKIYDLFNQYTITSETDLDGKITYVSQPFVDICGYSSDELIGHTHNKIKHEDTPDSVFKAMWGTITHKKTWRGQIKNRKKDGTAYWVDSVVFPILNEDDEIIGYKSIRVDITSKKIAEELLSDLISPSDIEITY